MEMETLQHPKAFQIYPNLILSACMGVNIRPVNVSGHHLLINLKKAILLTNTLENHLIGKLKTFFYIILTTNIKSSITEMNLNGLQELQVVVFTKIMCMLE